MQKVKKSIQHCIGYLDHLYKKGLICIRKYIIPQIIEMNIDFRHKEGFDLYLIATMVDMMIPANKISIITSRPLCPLIKLMRKLTRGNSHLLAKTEVRRKVLKCPQRNNPEWDETVWQPNCMSRVSGLKFL